MKSKLFVGLLTLITAIVISIVAAWFSIVGLVALFAASGTAIIIMGASLEVGKLVAWMWLKLNWSNKNVNFFHKIFVIIPIIALMLVTSVGIYGFLSAGHLEQKAPAAGISIQSQQIETQLAQKNNENERLETRLNQIDKNIAVFLENDRASQGLSASNRLKQERDDLQAQIKINYETINDLNNDLIPLKLENSAVEAKLGPVKYVAALFGWEDTEVAVRLIIVVIMLAFDPLAIILLISAMVTLREWRDGRNSENNIDQEIEPENSIVDEITDEEPEPEPIVEELEPEPIIEEPEPEPIVEEPEPEPIVEEPEPIIITKIVPAEITRDDVLEYFEKNADFLEEFRKEIEDENITDRDRLLNLLERNPSIINDMAEIIAGQMVNKKYKNENDKDENKKNSWID